MTLLVVMQEVTCKIEGKLFTIVTGYRQLAFQLAFGCSKLPIAQRMLHESVQLVPNQTKTAFYIVMITAKIHTPTACITIADHRTLNSIYESMTFTQ